MSSNIPPATAIVSPPSFDRLKEVARPAKDTDQPSLSGFRIEVIADPLERKVRAASISLETGHAVMFEGEEGEMLVVEPWIASESGFVVNRRGK